MHVAEFSINEYVCGYLEQDQNPLRWFSTLRCLAHPATPDEQSSTTEQGNQPEACSKH